MPTHPAHHKVPLPCCRYDAVTMGGQLEWQNSVTPLNLPFMEAAGSMFINYTWKEGTPAQVAALMGARSADVYMGVDVFGRGTYGGGQVGLCAAAVQGLGYLARCMSVLPPAYACCHRRALWRWCRLRGTSATLPAPTRWPTRSGN